MNLLSPGRPYLLSIFLAPLILFPFLPQLTYAQTPPAQTPPGPPPKPVHRAIPAQPPAVDQEQAIAYWTTETGWTSDLQLRNNAVGQDLTVTPVLRLADGAETSLAPVTIQPQEVKSIDLGAAISAAAAPQLVGAYGSLALRYRSPSQRSLYAAEMVRETGHPVAFHIDAMGPSEEFQAGSREGVWWLPKDTTSDYLILTNQGQNVLPVNLSLYDASGKENKQRVLLGRYETTRFSVRKLLQAAGLAGTYGGIKVSAPAHAGSLDTLHFLFDETAGFSAILKMFEDDPQTKLQERDYAATGVWTLRAPMLALSSPDPALAFPTGTTLRPQLFIRNTTAKPLDAVLRFNWRTASTTGKASGPTLHLFPYETRRVDVAALQGGTMQKQANWTSVTLTSNALPDEIVAVAASYDDTLRYGAQTPFSDQLSFKWEGGMWEYDPYHDSIITAGNGGTKPTQAAFTIFYNQGTQSYDLEQTLQPDEQMWIDVGKLIREQIPDKNGKALPMDLASGSYEFRDLTNKGVGTLFEGKIIYDKTYGHVAYGCGTCCGYSSAYVRVFFDPLGVPFRSTAGQGVNAYQNCTLTWDDVSDSFWSRWASANTAIATADYYGTHTGTGAGSTTSNSSGYLDLGHRAPNCPRFLVSPKGGVNVSVVSAVISQRTSGQVSTDDAAKQNYTNAEGTSNLGVILVAGCDLGVETVGNVNPSVYTGQVIIHRTRVARADYKNSTNIGNPGTVDDTSLPSFRDDDPQSGGSAGKVYDLDAPGVTPTDSNTYRERWNFYTYAALPDGTPISPNYYFYARVSCTKTVLGYQLVNDVPGDNQIGPGTTPLTWNLQ